MKLHYLISALLCALISHSYAQIVYSEDFGTGCSTGNTATAFGWTNTDTGFNEITPNIWYISAAEQGVGAGNCGTGCGGVNSRTLHLGTGPGAYGDLGASYLESSAFICSFLGLCSATDKRIESPVIDCSGVTSIPFTFEYIENGEGTADDGTVYYSANGGTTWSLLDNPPKTVICASGQGQWSTRNLVLPASADNNPNVKIGFRWVNNANGVGTDPSFAIDNIQIGEPVVLGVTMEEMDVSCINNTAEIKWSTSREINSLLFNVYKSFDAKQWARIGQVPSNNDESNANYYSLMDTHQYSDIAYYFIEQLDLNGKTTSYEILSNSNCGSFESVNVFPNPSNGSEIHVNYFKTNIDQVKIYSLDGRLVYDFINPIKENTILLSPNLTSGNYLMHVFSKNHVEIVSHQIKK